MNHIGSEVAISSRVDGLIHKIPPVLMLCAGITEDPRQREWVLAYPKNRGSA